MKDIYINGIGIISKCAQSVDALRAIAAGTVQDCGHGNCQIAFTPPVTHTQMRRCTRYAKLAVSSASFAVQDAPFIADLKKDAVGTVFATGHGTIAAMIQFAEVCLRGDPAKCSPIVFAGTVPNSTVGQICMVHGFTGPSTMLTGGDPIEYASLLVQTGKAQCVLSGAVEEYNEELAEALRLSNVPEGVTELSEGAASVIISGEPHENAYCRIRGFANTSLPYLPFAGVPEEDQLQYSIRCMAETLAMLPGVPELVLTAWNGGSFERAESAAVSRAFGDAVQCVPYKRFFGECLGAGYMQGVALAAAGIQSGAYAHSVCVTGIDAQGNYMAVLLEEI